MDNTLVGENKSDVLIDDKGYHYSMVLSENELRILTCALMALDKENQTIMKNNMVSVANCTINYAILSQRV